MNISEAARNRAFGPRPEGHERGISQRQYRAPYPRTSERGNVQPHRPTYKVPYTGNRRPRPIPNAHPEGGFYRTDHGSRVPYGNTKGV